MIKHTIAAGSVLAIAAAANAAVSASVTDQASVTASLASFTVEDFESFADVDFPAPGSQAFNGFTVSTPDSTGFPSDFAIRSNELSLFLDDGNLASFTFTFDSPVDTFAADFFLANPAVGSGIFFSFSNGDSIELNSTAAAGFTGNGFVSLTSDSTFTSFTISSNAGLDGFDLDNVVAGVIPAPGAAGLLGLAGLAAARRRR